MTIFTSSTQVTLFFSSWTTTSITTYLLLLLGLFMLALLNRFLATLRVQLYTASQPLSSSSVLRARRRRPATRTSKARVSPLPLYIQIDRGEDTHPGPVPPTPHGCKVEEEEEEGYNNNIEEASRPCLDKAEHTTICNRWTRLRDKLAKFLPHWTPRAPWSWRVDSGRGLLEGVRAFIGYLL